MHIKATLGSTFCGRKLLILVRRHLFLGGTVGRKGQGEAHRQTTRARHKEGEIEEMETGTRVKVGMERGK